jgi:putative ABC transport system permease protein
VALAWIAAQLVSSIRPPIPIPITITLAIDGRVLAFAAGAAILAGAVVGLMPALNATRPQLVGELKGDVVAARLGGRRVSLSDALVATQIALALVLLVGGGLLARTVAAAAGTSLGFEPARLAVVSAQMDLIGYDSAHAARFFERAVSRIRSAPGVEAVALAKRTPFAFDFNRNLVFLPDRHHAGDKGISIDATRVGAEYFATLGVSLLAGRNFSSVDTPSSPRVAIVNETMARRLWPHDSAVGKRFRLRSLDGPPVEIVGVVADYKVNTIGEGATPYIHYAYTQAPDGGQAVIARTRGDARALLATMRQELRALEPNVVLFDNQTMEAQVGTTLLPVRLGAIGVSVIGLLAMLLAAVGLYGAVAYSVGRRTREIGIRMALGATRGVVVRLVMQEGLRVAGWGLMFGALLALAAVRAASAALYGVSVVDPIAWGVAVAVVVVVAVVANLVPAAHAASVAPTIALRSE